MSKIKLIVGLANPGAEYAQTRHNAGAWYVDLLAERHNQPLKEEAKFFGYTARINMGGNDIRLLVPTTFMNLSGKSVAAIANFYRINLDEILVAHDELDLPPGVAKMKLGGSNGGHNGLKDIQSNSPITRIFIVYVLVLATQVIKTKWLALFWVNHRYLSKNSLMMRLMKRLGVQIFC